VFEIRAQIMNKNSNLKTAHVFRSLFPSTATAFRWGWADLSHALLHY